LVVKFTNVAHPKFLSKCPESFMITDYSHTI